MITADAYAKVNLGLRVAGRRDDGFHPLHGIFQSVTLTDSLRMEFADEDGITSSSGGPVPDGMDNLAFRAVAEVRAIAASRRSVLVTLDKGIPTAAGLGGGSADAAAALAMAGRVFGVDMDSLQLVAPHLGSDVPFCLRGGTARVSGRGEEIEALDPLRGFSLAIVVPPFEVSTPAVFRTWDELEEPTGLSVDANSLPPPLRVEGALINDLYPAAVALVPEIDDWRRTIEEAWSRPVMMSGSGPTFYGFFVDGDEASGALDAVPAGARLAEACELSPRGWAIQDQSSE